MDYYIRSNEYIHVIPRVIVNLVCRNNVHFLDHLQFGPCSFDAAKHSRHRRHIWQQLHQSILKREVVFPPSEWVVYNRRTLHSRLRRFPADLPVVVWNYWEWSTCSVSWWSITQLFEMRKEIRRKLLVANLETSDLNRDRVADALANVRPLNRSTASSSKKLWRAYTASDPRKLVREIHAAYPLAVARKLERQYKLHFPKMSGKSPYLQLSELDRSLLAAFANDWIFISWGFYEFQKECGFEDVYSNAFLRYRLHQWHFPKRGKPLIESNSNRRRLSERKLRLTQEGQSLLSDGHIGNTKIPRYRLGGLQLYSSRDPWFVQDSEFQQHRTT